MLYSVILSLLPYIHYLFPSLSPLDYETFQREFSVHHHHWLSVLWSDVCQYYFFSHYCRIGVASSCVSSCCFPIVYCLPPLSSRRSSQPHLYLHYRVMLLCCYVVVVFQSSIVYRCCYCCRLTSSHDQMSHVILTRHLPCRTVSVEWYVTTSTSFLSPYYPSYPRQIPSVEVVSLLLSYCLLISALIFLISHRNCCDILTVASILLLLLSPKSNHQVLLNSRSPLSSHCSLQLFASHITSSRCCCKLSTVYRFSFASQLC